MNPITLSESLSISPPTILAPMEGITDRPFRGLIREQGGCGLTVTEFVSSEGIKRMDPKAWRQAELDPYERPVGIQIYGRSPERMAEAAKICEGLGADLIDLNLGCPSKQVTSGCSGSALMREPDRAQEIFKAVKGAISIPMTVKMRLGWDEQRLNAPDIARRAEAEGAVMVTVHGRTRKQMYRGIADWSAISAVSDAVQIPVIVNGDILTDDDAIMALEQSGAAGVMIGRGALRDPWIFSRVSARLSGERFEEPSLESRQQVLLRYFDLLQQGVKSERHALGRIKKVVGFFTRGLPYGDHLRDEIFHLHDLAMVYHATRVYFERLDKEGVADGFSRLHNALPIGVTLDQRTEKFAVFDRQTSK